MRAEDGDLARKAAALMESIVRPPFVDGNKRTGIAAAGLFLRLNGQRLTATNDAVECFTLSVARGERSLDEMTTWFQPHSEPLDG